MYWWNTGGSLACGVGTEARLVSVVWWVDTVENQYVLTLESQSQLD